MRETEVKEGSYCLRVSTEHANISLQEKTIQHEMFELPKI